MKKSFMLLIMILLFILKNSSAEFSVNVGASFAEKEFSSVDLGASVYVTPTISVSPALTLFKSSSNKYGKNLSLNADFEFKYNIFLQLGLFAMPELDDYKNSGWNVNFGKSFGENIVFTPSLGLTHTAHYITYNISLPYRNIDSVVTTEISEFLFSPDLSISFYDYTRLELTYMKNNQTVYVRNRKEDLLELFKKNKLAQKIIVYTPNLYNTVSNFIDKAFTISVSQYIFYFFSLNLSFTRDIYLLPIDEDDTILKDNVTTLDAAFTITESITADLIFSYYKDTRDNKQFSTQISVGLYF